MPPLVNFFETKKVCHNLSLHGQHHHYQKGALLDLLSGLLRALRSLAGGVLLSRVRGGGVLHLLRVRVLPAEKSTNSQYTSYRLKALVVNTGQLNPPQHSEQTLQALCHLIEIEGFASSFPISIKC